MTTQTWPSSWLKGFLELAVLAVIADGETYGYEITGRLEETGLGTVKGGTLYPILTRLESEGLVTSAWRDGDGGPGRKFFTLTAAGGQALRERADQWRVFTERAAGLLASPSVPA